MSQQQLTDRQIDAQTDLFMDLDKSLQGKDIEQSIEVLLETDWSDVPDLEKVLENLEQDDQKILLNRIFNRGVDPLSVQLWLGKVDDCVRMAHHQSPASLEGEEKNLWLLLASVSDDEMNKDAWDDLCSQFKFEHFKAQVGKYLSYTEEEKTAAIAAKLKEIVEAKATPVTFKGVDTHAYMGDLGFASAYWSGKEHALVRSGNLTFVGSCNRPLKEIGWNADKEITPQFGIFFG